MSEQRGYDAVNACLAAIVCILMGNPDESRIIEVANRVGYGELPWNADVVRREIARACACGVSHTADTPSSEMSMEVYTDVIQ